MDLLVKCPTGTKYWILPLGRCRADAGWFKVGANTGMRGNEQPEREFVTGIFYAILIEHPHAGLILWETGVGKHVEELYGFPVADIFPRIDDDPLQNLDKQVELTGHKISDIKMIVLGHLHADHAGGLEEFRGSQVPVYVHEAELKNAYYAIATKTDAAVYKAACTPFEQNWVPVYGKSLEIAQGITLHHCPGHTPGLMIMQVNMPDSGTWIATSDMYLVKDNFEQNIPLGWLARDHQKWIESNQKIHELARRTNAKMLFGHDLETVLQYRLAPYAYS